MPGTGGNVVAYTTVYWFGNYEEEFVNSKLSARVKLYSANEGVFAQRTVTLDDEKKVTSNTLSYMFKDQLGSTLMTFGTDGKLTGRYAYEPFGKMIYREEAASNGMRRTFTGHMLEDDDGLYYCHARWYDSTVGRFLQADSVLDGFNRYAYCHNNPIRFADPTGNHCWPWPDWMFGKGGSESGGQGSGSDDDGSPSSDSTSTTGEEGSSGSSSTSNSSYNPSQSPTALYNYYPSVPKETKRIDPHGADGQGGAQNHRIDVSLLLSTMGNTATYGQIVTYTRALFKASKTFGNCSAFLGGFSLAMDLSDFLESIKNQDAFGIIDFGLDAVLYGIGYV